MSAGAAPYAGPDQPAGLRASGGARPAVLPPAFAPAQHRAALVSVGAPVAGTVLRIDAAPRRRVAAGTVLVELNPVSYRVAVGEAQRRLASLQSQITAAQSALAAGQRRAVSGVTAAVGSAKTMPPAPAPPPLVVPHIDAAIKAQLTESRRAIAAARTQMESDAQSEAASTKQTLDRDEALLSQGLIAARQVETDRAAYAAAQAQVAAAQTAFRQPDSTGRASLAPNGVGQAQAAIAAARQHVAAAQTAASAAKNVLDRDRALLAEGAVAAHQVAADTIVKDAADARGRAAAAELQRAQAELTAARAEGAAAEAMRREAEIIRRAQAARAQHAAQTRTLARQAASTIATTVQQAQALAVLETEAITAETALQRSEADLAQTMVRAPSAGWVATTVAAGKNVRTGDPVALIEVDPAAPAQAAAARPAQPAGARARLAQIAASERGMLAQLNAESAQIASITSAGIPETPPPPGTALSPVPYGAEQSGGTTPTLLNGRMPWPVAGAVTSGYGWRIHPIFDTPEFHTGIDIAASMGTPVEAPAAGTVIFAGSLPANGTLVILDHGSGVTTTYSHLSGYGVYVGEHVQRGQVIAQVGSTGWSTGPHLFFEIRKDGHPIDPLSN
jgi:murein DD-endopeptidase MepM/ murein hydrolase activator NlpD